jgi:hypothetical protein
MTPTLEEFLANEKYLLDKGILSYGNVKRLIDTATELLNQRNLLFEHLDGLEQETQSTRQEWDKGLRELLVGGGA